MSKFLSLRALLGLSVITVSLITVSAITILANAQDPPASDDLEFLLNDQGGAEKPTADQPAEQSSGDSDLSPDAAAVARIEAVLDKQTSLDFQGASLTKVASTIQSKHNIQVKLDKAALEDLGVDPKETIVRFKLADVRLGTGLAMLLEQLELTVIIENEVLVITSREEADKRLTTKVYPVRDLVMVYQQDKSLPPEDDYDSLIETITRIIDSPTWDEIGGPGSIEGFRGLLIVSQTLDVHQHVEQFLRAAEKSIALQRKKPTDFASVRLGNLAGAESIIEKALETKNSIFIADADLNEFAKRLATKFNIQVMFDRVALEDLGVDPKETTIEFEANDVTLRSMLNLALAEFELTFVIQENVLLITSMEEADKRLSVRLYPVGDLVTPENQDESAADKVGQNQSGVPARFAQFGGGSGGFGGSGPYPAIGRYSDSSEDDFDSLIEVLVTTVDPESWDEVGGPASIVGLEVGKMLVIAQTYNTHRKIEALLRQIRKTIRKVKSKPGAKKKAADENEIVLIVYLFDLAPRDDARDVKQVDSKEVVELIRELIRPKSWKDEPQAYLRAITGGVVIRHKVGVQRDVRKFLEKLGVIMPVYQSGNDYPVGSGL